MWGCRGCRGGGVVTIVGREVFSVFFRCGGGLWQGSGRVSRGPGGLSDVGGVGCARCGTWCSSAEKRQAWAWIRGRTLMARAWLQGMGKEGVWDRLQWVIDLRRVLGAHDKARHTGRAMRRMKRYVYLDLL